MRDEVLYPGKVRIDGGRNAINPALVRLQQVAAPVAVIEWWIGDHIISLQIRVAVVMEGITVRDLGVDAANGKVHLGKTPGGVV